MIDQSTKNETSIAPINLRELLEQRAGSTPDKIFLLSEPDRQTVRSHLADIRHQVKLLFFTQTIGGPESALLARQVLDEVEILSFRLTTSSRK